MVKNNRLNMRLDDYTETILSGVMDKTGEDKSKVVRAAIEYYANYILGQDEVMNIRLYQLYDNK